MSDPTKEKEETTTTSSVPLATEKGGAGGGGETVNTNNDGPDDKGTIADVEAKEEADGGTSDADRSGDNGDDAKDSRRNNKSGKTKKMNPYGRSKSKRKKREGLSSEERRRIYRRNDDLESDLVPNLGSYAHPDMQEKFGINLVDDDETLRQQPSAGDGARVDGTADEEGPPRQKESGETLPNNNRAPKKKVALLVAFIGESYSGMQINAGTKTIQGEMDYALYKAGYLSKSNFGFPQKYSWSNAARTDRGVHAAAQVCSVKIELPPSSTMDDVRERINAQLPDDVRILDVCRTTRNFCARTQRDRARYMYMIPSFVLCDRDELRGMFESRGCTTNGRSAADPLSGHEMDGLRSDVLVKYRARPEQMDRLRRCLSAFEGTHAFHNFTRGKESADPSTRRFIESFQVLDPVLSPESDGGGMEWIPTLVLGQSFLLNQIRKMISLAVDVARDAAPTSALQESMAPGRQMLLGLAPAQGLFLDMSFYGQYNRRKAPDCPLDWVTDATSPAVKRWREFRDTRIMTHIMEEEVRDGNFVKYLYQQEYHFDRRRYLPLGDDDADQEGKRQDR